MAKVSVIIPICNVEKYIDQCLESVISQTLADIEIICIDDGSADASGDIADRYGRADSRVKVIHKENAGYGSAVNLGISMATGEYIGIVESDDFIERDMYETLYDIARQKNLDYIKSRYYEFSNTERKVVTAFPFCDYEIVYSEYENMNKLFLPKSIWAGLYKRSFLLDKEIKLLETAGASYQDTGFWFKVCISAHRGMLIKDAFVNYRLDNSNSSVKSLGKVFCICDEIEECRRYLEKSDLKKEIILPYFFKYMYTCYYWNSRRIDEAYLEDFLVKTSMAMKEASKTLKPRRELLTLSEWETISIWAETPQVYCRMLLNDKIMQYNTRVYIELFQQYTAEKHIYIYGAGKVGRRLEAMIKKFNPKCRVEFLISGLAQNMGNIHSINDADINKKCKVIIAVADFTTRLEMRRTAQEAGFVDIFVWDAGMDFVCSVLDMEKICQPDGEYGEMNLREVLLEEKLVDGIEDVAEASIILNLARLNKGNVVIYGAGQMGACIARWMSFHGVMPVYFIDADIAKRGTRLENIEVKHISDIGTEEKRNSYVTIGFRPYETDINEREKIDSILIEHGFLKENIFYMASLNTSMLCRRKYYIDHIEELEWLHERLGDEESKQTLVELVRSITQNDSYLLREHMYDDKYWGCDFEGNDSIYVHIKDECFVNCGSCTGDTIFKFLGKGYEFSNIYAIEGDKKMYNRLCGNIDRLDEKYKERILLKNIYIGTDDEENKFDNLFKDIRVTLINADIEGAEMGVLRGARQIIKNQRPVIAFCAYHRQEDPYEIVRLIDEVGTDYHFFLRKYPAKAARLPIEFVIYAIPGERLLRDKN